MLKRNLLVSILVPALIFSMTLSVMGASDGEENPSYNLEWDYSENGADVQKINTTVEFPGEAPMEIPNDYRFLMVDGTLVPEGRIVIFNDLSLAPLRVVSEKLGATVDWNGDEQKVTITKGEAVIELVINAESALVSGETVSLEAPAKIINDSTYVPLRFISDYLDGKIGYHDSLPFAEYPLIWIENGDLHDEETITADQAVEDTKELLLSVVDEFAEKNNLGENEKVHAIESIDKLECVGELSCYWILADGNYQYEDGQSNILVNKHTGKAYHYRYFYSSFTFFDIDVEGITTMYFAA